MLDFTYDKSYHISSDDIAMSPQEKFLTNKYTWCIFRYIGIKRQSITTFVYLINKQVRRYNNLANKVTLLHICQSRTAFIMFDVPTTPVNIFPKYGHNLKNLNILKIYRQQLV